MGSLSGLSQWFARTAAEWQLVRQGLLLYERRDWVLLGLGLFAGAAVLTLVIRLIASGVSVRRGVALPAILGGWRRSYLSSIRHVPLLLFLAGLPLFALALADPATSLTRQDVSYPGRRISLMIDGSSSMIAPFSAQKLRTAGQPMEAVFFTTVAAAETFIKMRMNGQYRDLLSLIEFGDQAYVITPFTTDYENILLSLSLIGNMSEWENFPDQGTVIAQAVEQAVALFRAFEFLDASGNLMVIFSDGEDAEVTEAGRTIDDVLRDAVRSRIPVYFVRISKGNTKLPDDMWRRAVERTGGRFYTAADEATILRAISEIDKASAGTIEVREYSTRLPRFSPFALGAAGLWTLALALRLIVPQFQTFP